MNDNKTDNIIQHNSSNISEIKCNKESLNNDISGIHNNDNNNFENKSDNESISTKKQTDTN
jgi:hypothetical protein